MSSMFVCVCLGASFGCSSAMHSAGSLVAEAELLSDGQLLTEAGLKYIVEQNSSEAQNTFIHRLVRAQAGGALTERAVSNFVNKYTGGLSMRSFTQLRDEIKEALWSRLPFFTAPLIPVGSVVDSTFKFFTPASVENSSTSSLMNATTKANVTVAIAAGSTTEPKASAARNATPVVAANASADGMAAGAKRPGQTYMRRANASSGVDVNTVLDAGAGARSHTGTGEDTLPILKALADVETKVSAQSDEARSSNRSRQTRSTAAAGARQLTGEGATREIREADRVVAKAAASLEAAKSKERWARQARLEVAKKLRAAEAMEKLKEGSKEKASDRVKASHFTKTEFSEKLKKARTDAKLKAQRESTTKADSSNGTDKSLDQSIRKAERTMDVETRRMAMRTAEEQVRSEVEVNMQDAKDKLSEAEHQVEVAHGAKVKVETAFKEALDKEEELHARTMSALNASRAANLTRQDAFREARKKSALVYHLQDKEKELTQARNKVAKEFGEAKAAWLQASRALNSTVAANQKAAAAAAASQEVARQASSSATSMARRVLEQAAATLLNHTMNIQPE